MKYRALARDIRIDEKPVQIYGGDLFYIREWARAVAEKHHVKVDIHVTKEELLETVEPVTNA